MSRRAPRLARCTVSLPIRVPEHGQRQIVVMMGHTSPGVWYDRAGRCHDLAAWLYGPARPVLPGVYQRACLSGELMYSRWDGRQWCWYAPTPELAGRQCGRSVVQTLPWRGLAAPHEPTPTGAHA
jgi:hypothetical protein